MNTRHVGRIARAALKPAMLCSTILGSFAFVGGSGFVAKAADDPAHWLDGGSIYGRFEMLYLQRQVTSGIPLGFVDAPGDGYIALRSNDLRFDHEPGGRFAIGWRPDYYNAIELSFLLLNSHKSSRAVTDANENLQPIFSNDGSFLNIGSFEDAERYTITYRTSLNSVEISYRRRTDWWGGFRANFTGGPRFVQLNEKFRLISDDSLPPSPSNTGDYSIRADNRLFGAQLGVEVNYRFDRARTIGFDLVGRVGVYANQAKQDTIVLDESAQVFAASVDRVRLATTMDAGLYFVWEPVPNLTLRAGYELLFINGVALAPQQMATTNSAGAFSQLNMSGNVLYHGASVRLTYNFCYNSCPTPENNAIRFAPPPMPAMRPAIYAGAEFLYLRRASTDGVALAFLDDGATSPVVLRSNDLGLGSEPAVRVTVGYRFDARNSVEIGFSYLGRHKSSASATGAALDSTFLEEEFITDDSFDNASQFSAVHSSRGWSTELNLRRELGMWGGFKLAGLIGFRYVDFREKLEVSTINPFDGPGQYNIRTTNRMYGGQIGVSIAYEFDFIKGFGIAFDGKAAILANSARQSTDIFSAGSQQIDTGASKTGMGTLAEATIRATYSPIPNLEISAGYTVIHIGGVALAPNNYASTNTTNSFTQIHKSGSALYHGLTVGMKYAFSL